MALEKAKKDSAAKMCKLCRQTFMVNARPPLLWQHIVAKHPEGTAPTDCFDELAGFDPNDPKGEKKAAADKAAAAKAKKKKSTTADLDSLLDAGLPVKGKKK